MNIENINVRSSQFTKTGFDAELEGLEVVPDVVNILFVTTFDVVRVLYVIVTSENRVVRFSCNAQLAFHETNLGANDQLIADSTSLLPFANELLRRSILT